MAGANPIFSATAPQTASPQLGLAGGFSGLHGFLGQQFCRAFSHRRRRADDWLRQAYGLNRDHRLIKAILMNSGVTALDDDGSPWANSQTVPLDNQQGTGILNLQRGLCHVFRRPATVRPGGRARLDFTTIFGTYAPGPNIPAPPMAS